MIILNNLSNKFQKIRNESNLAKKKCNVFKTRSKNNKNINIHQFTKK